MLARASVQSGRRLSRHAPVAYAAKLAAVFAAMSFAVGPAGADCPASDIICLDGDPENLGSTSTTTSPTFDTICSGVVLNVAGANFDVPAGSFQVYVGEGGRIDLRLRDAFTVTGPAPGSPISLHMRVRFHGSLNYAFSCCPDSQVRLVLLPLEPQADDPAPAWSFGRSAPPYQLYSFEDSLDFTLQRTAGAPIGIEIHALSILDGASSSNLIGQFSFPDLPTGWTVSSCKGYREEEPVPALAASWGRLKAAYR